MNFGCNHKEIKKKKTTQPKATKMRPSQPKCNQIGNQRQPKCKQWQPKCNQWQPKCNLLTTKTQPATTKMQPVATKMQPIGNQNATSGNQNATSGNQNAASDNQNATSGNQNATNGQPKCNQWQPKCNQWQPKCNQLTTKMQPVATNMQPTCEQGEATLQTMGSNACAGFRRLAKGILRRNFWNRMRGVPFGTLWQRLYPMMVRGGDGESGRKVCGTIGFASREVKSKGERWRTRWRS